MRVVKIRKKNGKFRTIYVPNRGEKKKLRRILLNLSARVEKTCEDCVHGFRPGRSPATNAVAHVGHQFTTCFDLQDFFDTVTPEMIPDLTEEETRYCFLDGAARQGLPTSPALANLAAHKLDLLLLEWCQANKVIFTRYADDLSFSYDDPNLTPLLKQVVPTMVQECGFQINPSKTRTQWATQGRRFITGVAVDNEVYPTRKHKRMLRASIHQSNGLQARGLGAWIAYLVEHGWELSDLEKLVSDWLGEKVRTTPKQVKFDGEGGFSLN